jgi:hypothetical protein
MEVSEGVELELWKGGNSKKASQLRIDGRLESMRCTELGDDKRCGCYVEDCRAITLEALELATDSELGAESHPSAPA